MAAWARTAFLCALLGVAPLRTGAAPLLAARIPPADAATPGQVLVRFHDRLSDEERREALSRCGLSPLETLHGLDIALAAANDPSSAAELASRLRRSSAVLWAEPNHRCRVALAAPNDPAYAELFGDLYLQWPAHSLDALGAWTRYPGRYFDAASRPQEAPIIALIDTGVDASHPDFANPGALSGDAMEGGQLLLSLARAFLSGGPGDGAADVTDEHGHGTHLAGLIAAAADNGTTAGSGIAGLGYPLRLLPLKVAGPSGVATHADIARAIVYAADQGSSVILIAFAGPTWSQTLQDAVDYAWNRGCLLVAPAGDAGAGVPVFPAACPHVFAVAALTASGSPASYSTSGDHVALAAPGGDEAAGIYSTLPTYPCTLRQDLTGPAYGWAFGTSQAAAHAAAAAGLRDGLTGTHPRTGDEGVALWQALQQSAAAAEDPAAAVWRSDRGYGALALALLLAEEEPDGGLGSLVGRVLLHSDPALGASVSASPTGGGTTVTVETQWPAGAYRIPNLAAGVYRVTAQAGDLTAERDPVTVLPGCDAPAVDFRLGDPAPGAAVVSAQLPGAAVRGGSMDISLAFANSGDSTWRRDDGYCLTQVRCESAIEGAPEVVALAPGEAIPPGGERTFSISLAAPDDFGFYETAWRMSQQGGAGPFGETARGTISVTSFLDVRADHWAVREIEAARDAGIVCGYGDDLYQPAAPVSRDQMAVYLARALAGGDESVPAGPDNPTFADVGIEHWAYRYIEYTCAQGVVQGYPGNLYCPEYLLDRGQMAVFVARSLAGGEAGLADYVPPEAPTFADVSPESWTYAAVEYLTAGGTVSGYPDHLYHPEYICSRDQIAVYISRAFGLIGP